MPVNHNVQQSALLSCHRCMIKHMPSLKSKHENGSVSAKHFKGWMGYDYYLIDYKRYFQLTPRQQGFFFLEHAGELRIIVLIEEESHT